MDPAWLSPPFTGRGGRQGLVAVATAWSGYQAALWTGHQSEQYGVASKLRVQAEGMQTTANQERLYDASMVAEWIRAEAHVSRARLTISRG